MALTITKFGMRDIIPWRGSSSGHHHATISPPHEGVPPTNLLLSVILKELSDLNEDMIRGSF